MTPADLISACEGRETVTLVLPRRNCSGEKIRLCGRSGPLGTLLCDNGSGLVVRFKAAAVLAWVRKMSQNPA